MKNNKGFSLVELLIVIAILSILTGASVNAISHMRYANTKKCTELISRALDDVRVETLSKSAKPYLYIYNYNSNYYIKTDTNGGLTVAGGGLDGNAKKIANGRGSITISWQTEPSSGTAPAATVMDSGKFIRISYKKSTGALEGQKDVEGVSCLNPAPDNCNLHCDTIFIKGTSTHTIHLIKSTGKHTVD